MVDKRKYTKAELKKLYTNLRRKGITDDMAGILIEHCYNQKTIQRTSGFYYVGAPDAEISWNDATRTFTISPLIPDPLPTDSYGNKYSPHIRFFSWGNGPVLHRKYAAESIQLPNEEGLFAIYFDSNTETRAQELTYKKNPTEPETRKIYEEKVLIDWIYWDATSGAAIYHGDSRHGSEWNPQIHWTWHQTLNSIRQDGLTIVDAIYNGDGSNDTHYQFGITEGKLWHEDILGSTEAVGVTEGLPVWYFDASGLPRYDAQSGKKFLNTGSGRVAFNSSGLAEATNNYYVMYHLFATNCSLNEIISVMGQAEYETFENAVAAIGDEKQTVRQLLPHSNLMHIKTIIIQTSDDYTNSAKARMVSDEETQHIVTQPSHGFSVKQAIRHNGTQFVLAQANSAENAQTVGIVVEVIDGDNFIYQSEGFFLHADWLAGSSYFLSPDTAGLITDAPTWTYPDDIGKISQLVGYGTDRGLKIEIDAGRLVKAIDNEFPGALMYFGTNTDEEWNYHSLTEGVTIVAKNATVDSIVDADTINFLKSDILKKISWSNIKATLKTYFDTIYSLIDHLHDDRYYTETEIDSKLGFKEDKADKGVANGYAELDSGGKVPSSQLPAYVDEVVEGANLASFPATGEASKIYIALDTNKTYRWGGSSYIEISQGVTLGETSATAYRGDRGKAAYDHSQLTTGNPHNIDKGDVGLSNVDNTSDADKPVSTAQQNALNGKADTGHNHTLSDITDAGSMAAKDYWFGTQAQYDALGSYDSNTLYHIIET